MNKHYGPHHERLLAVAADSAGGLLAVGGRRDGERTSQVHVLTLPKLTPLAALAADGDVRALTFAGERLLAAGSGAGTLLLWSVADERPEPTPNFGTDAHQGALTALAGDPVGGRLLSVGEDGVARLYRLRDDRAEAELLAQRPLSSQPLQVAALNDDATLAATAGADSQIYVLPLAEFGSAEPRVMRCGEGGISALAFSDDGRIVAGCGDGSLWSCYLEGAADQERRSGDHGHAAPLGGLCFSPPRYDLQDQPLARRLYSIAADGDLKVWELDSRRRPRSLRIGRGASALTLLPAAAGAKPEQAGGTLAIVSKQRRLRLLPVATDGSPNEPQPEQLWRSRLEHLLDQLAGRQPSARVLEALAELGEDEARQGLERALAEDGRAAQRALAARLLGDSDRRRSRPALRAALNDDHPQVRAAALTALERLETRLDDADKNGAALTALQAALRSRHEDLRLRALERLPGLRKTSPLAARLIGDSLNDRAERVRRAALDALLVVPPDTAFDLVTALRGAFQRGPADVRLAALQRLGQRQPDLAASDAGQQLLGQALDDSDPEVRAGAFWVSVSARPALAGRITAGATPELRKRLAEYFDPQPQPRARLSEQDLEPLFTALASRDPLLALQSAACLAALGDQRASGTLLQLSRDPDVKVRLATARTLAQASASLPGDQRLRQRLDWLLNDTDAGVRAQAFASLAELAAVDGAVGEVELAAAALRTPAPDIRQRALQLLVKHGAKAQAGLAERIDALLGDALDDEDQNVRQEALRTLWAWYSKRPQTVLARAVASTQGDIRRRAVEELVRQKAWAKPLLLARVGDPLAEVGLAALEALAKAAKDRPGAEVCLAALRSPAAEVRLQGLRHARDLKEPPPSVLRARLIELLQSERVEEFSAAVETLDALLPDDAQGFALAFDSPFYALQVRAGELCAKRRDARAVGPLQRLLSITPADPERPSDGLRQRAASALAEIGASASRDFFTALLGDDDPLVREMAARGLATACRDGEQQPLLDALAHPDLAVRSWAADGLAKLGDRRAVPVLAGTQQHQHLPIRRGALLSFVALGGDGVQGILQGLQDPSRELQELVFAVIVARDIALVRAGIAPDLLLSALSAGQPEVRYAAARALEARLRQEDLADWALELVGPRLPERAAERERWPPETQRPALLNALINALASDRPEKRYAAAQVLSLRPQPDSFWRELGRLASADDKGDSPATAPQLEPPQARKTGWLRGLFSRPQPAEGPATRRLLTVLRFAGGGRAVPPADATPSDDQLWRLAFGVYTGLLRQTADQDGGADDGTVARVRRDSLTRLTALAERPAVGRPAVLAVLRQALNDPHHLVRRAALNALLTLHPEQPLQPLMLALQARAADLGRQALEQLIARAQAGDRGSEAAAVARTAINAATPEVRRYALDQLPRLYPAGSLEPWLLALDSHYDDLRLAVVDRLADADDPRVVGALDRALESDHDELRLKAASALAERGEPRSAEVLAAALYDQNNAVSGQALAALVALAHARAAGDPAGEHTADRAATAARAVAARLDNDPDYSAERGALLPALARIGHPAAVPTLARLLQDHNDAAVPFHLVAAETLISLLQDRQQPPPRDRRQADPAPRRRLLEPLALDALPALLDHPQAAVRRTAVTALGDLDAADAETLLLKLLDDRDPDIRTLACQQLARRIAAEVPGASLEPLQQALQSGRRELLLTAAEGLALRRRPEALQPLLLAFTAGDDSERQRATHALGTLGDRRALEYLEPLLAPDAELSADDRALAPHAAEALGTLLPQLADDEERDRVRTTLGRLARDGRALRHAALVGLRNAGDAPARRLLEQIASDAYDDSALRLVAVQQLQRLGDPASEPALAALLDSPDRALRHTSLAALEHTFRDQPGRAYLPALASSQTDISRQAAVFLGRHGDPTTLLRGLADADIVDPLVRQRLRRGLSRRGLAAVEALGELLRDANPRARTEAALLAADSADPAALAGLPLSAALRHAQQGWRQARERHDDTAQGDEQHAWQAGFWAAARLSLDAGDPARAALNEPHCPAGVRRAALVCLARHGSPADGELLRGFLSDADPGIRSAAASAMASSARVDDAVLSETTAATNSTAELQPLLEAALAAPGETTDLLSDPRRRRLSLPVYLGQQRADELLAAARAGAVEQRVAALNALGRLSGAAAGVRTELEKLLADGTGNDAVRAAAFRALRRLDRAAERTAVQVAAIDR